MKLALVSKNVGHKNKSTTLNTYYKCKNDYEDNLAIQNEIFKIYDFDFGGGGQTEAPKTAPLQLWRLPIGEDKYFIYLRYLRFPAVAKPRYQRRGFR